MSRAARLLDLIQALRRRRRPVTAADLAAELEVSARTVYRDIATLVAQGAPIEGAAGLGYVMGPGFFLPPLMFGDDEVDALLLGLRLVIGRGDPELSDAAEDALAKVVTMLPTAQGEQAVASGLVAPPSSTGPACLGPIRQALRDEVKLRIAYGDKRGQTTERTVWPVAVGFFEASEVLAAWCEMRGDFRHFRLDRIGAVSVLPDRLPRRRRLLLAEWRAQEDLDG